jgi:hypothetical protein
MRVSRAHKCAADVPFDPSAEAPLQFSSTLEGAMCTKIPYANRWLARRTLLKLRSQGRAVRSIHPCFADHPGAWHVTSLSRDKW